MLNGFKTTTFLAYTQATMTPTGAMRGGFGAGAGCGASRGNGTSSLALSPFASGALWSATPPSVWADALCGELAILLGCIALRAHTRSMGGTSSS